MKIGIIGAGNIGGNLTRRLTALGHDVSVANSRGPQTLTALAEETGATPVPVEEAARGAEIVVVTVPLKRVPDLPSGVLDGAADGFAVIDTGNYYPQRDGRIAGIEDEGRTESRWTEGHLGHPVVKAFNGTYAQDILDRHRPAGAPAARRSRWPATTPPPRRRSARSSTSWASTPSTPAASTTPGASSPALRSTACAPAWRASPRPWRRPRRSGPRTSGADSGQGPAQGCAHSLSAALLEKSAAFVSTGSSVYWWKRQSAWMRGLPADT